MVLFIISFMTVIIPLLYWIFTGNDFIEIKDKIL